MVHPLPLTGERTLPGVDREAYWFARHLAAYEWAAAELSDLRAGAVVLEAGAGEGYGAALVADRLSAVVLAVDYDADSCSHAHRAYPQIRAARANLAGLPVGTGQADALVTMQVVEHLWDLPGFLADARRVLRSGGRLLASTPNRPVQSPGLRRGQTPVNPFHVREFDAEELVELVRAAGFEQVRILGLHHGVRLRSWEDRHGSIVQAQVDAILAGSWPSDLAGAVSQVRAGDFEVREWCESPARAAAARSAGADPAYDLIVVAARP